MLARGHQAQGEDQVKLTTWMVEKTTRISGLLPAEITDQGSAYGLTDRINDLFLGEFRPLHRSTPFARDHRSRQCTLVSTSRRFSGETSIPRR